MSIDANDWLAFLNAIREDPEDDISRLVFADYLEENGEADRAELIRLQCQLARGVEDPDLRHRQHLRVHELIEQHGLTWLGGLRTRIDQWHWSRGMLSVTMAAHRFRRSAKLFAPALAQEVRLSGTIDEIVDALRSPALAQFHSLSLASNELTDENTEYLLLYRTRRDGIAWPNYRLDLRNNRISQSVALLCESESLRSLKYLELDGNPLEPVARRLLHLSAWAAHYRPTPAGQFPRMLINSIGMRFIRIPAGTFLMGSTPDEPHHESDEFQHSVTLTRDYYMAITPVTQSQFTDVTGKTPSDYTPEGVMTLAHPVERVTWHDAVNFCELLSARIQERHASRTYQLPTEAQWEYACRAGRQTAYSCGNRLTHSDANYLRQVGHPTAVGSYPPNPWGLFDMHGNLREWCADWYDRDTYRQSANVSDPTGPTDGTNRVLRGGSWDVVAGNYCRSAYRVYFSPTNHMNGIGFRVIIPLPEAS